jgi:O-Antigen ligase
MSIDLSIFAPAKSKSQLFLDRYQYFLSIVATFFFFSEIPAYCLDANILPFNVLAWIITFGLLSLPFVNKLANMPKPLVVAMGLYLSISLISFATVNGDDASTEELRKRLLAVLFVCMMYIIYEQRSFRQVKYALLAVILMSIFNNFYELLNPDAFATITSGRPAGFYLNPTKTGCALMLGMILTVNILKKPYRWLYVLLVGVGLLLTFTRGAIVGWVICVAILIGNRILSNKRRTVIFSMLILVSFLAIVNPLNSLGNYFSGGTNSAYSNVISRLDQFQNPSIEDDSAKERSLVAKYAWKLFGDRPFWGYGLSSTNKWTVAQVSTHNMYLYFMMDHGVIGLIMFPGAIFALIYRNRGEDKTIIICFAIFLAVWGLFSHNVLEEWYILTTFSLLAAMKTSQDWHLKYATPKFQLALPPARAQLLLPPARERRRLPPPYIPPIRKQLLLPPAREQKALPPSRE